jgi:dTDP-4-amino-4,6-dideoxygalactose transaminase
MLENIERVQSFIPIARPMVGTDELEAVQRVLASGNLAQGAVVAEFEEAFAATCQVRYAVAVTNGTLALHAALMAYDIGPGDEVITTPFTFIASANAIRATGATPVFADIDPATFTIDPAAIRAAITPRTVAIMPIHLFGHPAAMPEIMEIAHHHGLAVIEDACQAHGAAIDGVPVGGYGAGCFSFYPTKNITSGEGGMVTTNNAAIADAVRLFRQHGMRRRYYHEAFGLNYRMTDLLAAIGLAQLQHLDKWNAIRQQHAQRLTCGLDAAGLELPVIRPCYTHVFHQYTIRVRHKRDDFRQRLADSGIGSEVYYPVPVHRQQIYADAYRDGMFPETERATREVLSLPVHPSLVDDEIDRVITGVGDAMRREGGVYANGNRPGDAG